MLQDRGQLSNISISAINNKCYKITNKSKINLRFFKTIINKIKTKNN